MRERESESARTSDEDILGIEWPEEPLPAELIATIVLSSRSKSLREIIASLVVHESDNLWAKIKPRDYDTSPGTRSAQDIAINKGYWGAGWHILVACNYFSDRDGAVGVQVTSVEMLEKLTMKGPFSTMPGVGPALREDLHGEMKWAIESLIIDPSGIDWIKQRLGTKEVVWNKMIQGGKMFGLGEDPEVIGLRRGIERYRNHYSQAVHAGATPDKTTRREMAAALVKRKIREFRESTPIEILRYLLSAH